MNQSEGQEFALLIEGLGGKTTLDDVVFTEPAQARLVRSIRDPATTGLDLAVLMRHVLLSEAARRGPESSPSLPLPQARSIERDDLARAGLDVDRAGRCRALPWEPVWLPGEGAPDVSAASGEVLRFGAADTGADGDPFLVQRHLRRYRSVGQRAAIRAALLTPPGQTTAIDLPTGEGKSLVFQLVDRLRFASDRADLRDRQGITLVAVPTVALAYDHEVKCRRSSDEVLAYVGGGEQDRKARLLARLAEAQDGLVFAAPEAVCRTLRPPLLAAARAGKLKAIVIDEAHLVDAWGTGFRSEFQSLAGLRTELLAAAPPNHAPRTLLLSATLTTDTLATLSALFGGSDGLRTVSASQVRPEPDYWVAATTDHDMRIQRVLEAVHHLPRPLILYVTEVKQAQQWEHRLSEVGYGRLASFHGDTPDNRRQEVLTLWSAGQLDLVVATSAFGLGIDYPHVRTVLHACVPETFDRFYQEVGRGGRDGRRSVSLLVPALTDFPLAKRLNTEKVITLERGLKRWRAMFEHPDREHLGGMRFRMRLDVAPGGDIDDIDLTGRRSVNWNVRILNLLARAGILRLIGGDIPEEAEGVQEVVEILDEGHLEPAVWEVRVEPVRAAIYSSRHSSLQLMHRHIQGDTCPSDLVRELYGGPKVDRACSRCALCRASPTCQHPTDLRREPCSPWSPPTLTPMLQRILDDEGRLVVTYEPEASGPREQRWAAMAMDGLWRGGIRSLTVLGRVPPLFMRTLDELGKLPVFVEKIDKIGLSRLPDGPRAVLVGDGVFRRPAATSGQPRVVLVPVGYPDPEQPMEPLLERWNVPVMTLAELRRRTET